VNYLRQIRIITAVLIIFTVRLSSNDVTDSLEKTLNTARGKEKIEILNRLAGEYLITLPDKSIAYGSQALGIAEELNDKSAECESYNYIGKGNFFKKDFSKALINYDKAYDLAQSLKDDKETAKILNNYGALYYTNNQYEKALDYYKKALAIREKLGDKSEIAKTFKNLAELYLRWGKYDKALDYHQKLLAMWESDGNKSEIANSYNSIGEIYFELGQNYTALEYFLKEIKLRDEMGDKEKMDDFLYNIAKIYYTMQNYPKAIEYYQKALKLTLAGGNKIKIGQTLTSIGNTYYDWKKYNQALYYYNKSLKIAEEQGSKIGKAIILNNIGLVYKNLGNYQKALEYCKQSLDIRIAEKQKIELFYPLTSIAEIELKLGDYEKALGYLNQALQLAQEDNQKKLIKDSYYLLHEVYAMSGDYKTALAYHKLYSDLKDSLSIEESNKKFTEAQVKWESEQKEKENRLLLHTKELQRNFFFVILGLLVLLLFVILNRYLNKHKANKLLNEKNQQINSQHNKLEEMYRELQLKEETLREANATKDKFFAIIAHDLKNPLHSITLSSDLLINKFRQMSGEQLLDLINSIYKSGKHLSSLLENLLQWSRTQSGKIEFDPIMFDIHELCVENISLLIGNATKKKIQIQNEVKDSIFVYADPNMISAVIRNLISNAIKFTHEYGLVTVNASEESNYIEISVTDNGIGISDEDIKKLFRLDIHHTTIGTSKEKGTGLGLILSKEFVEINGGKIWASSKLGNGAVFKFTLPKAPKNVDKIEVEEELAL
jgi:signal transduction histidine kinase/Tfp pilus assembly protein PilF